MSVLQIPNPKIEDSFCRLPIANFYKNCRLAIVLWGLILFNGCANTDPNDTPVISGVPSTAYPMPPLSGASLANLGWELEDGNRSVFSEYKGKVLLLDFYATWCAPCRDSVPHLVGLQDKYKDQGLVVIGLNVGGPKDEPQIPAFAKRFGIQYTLAKPDDELAGFLLSNDTRIPQTFVFDREGKLIERLIGFGKQSGEIIDRAVEQALKTPAQ